MEVILDTSFILSCLGKKIDFLEAERFGSLVLPLQVLNELDKIKKKHGKESQQASLALQIIEKNKDKFKIIVLEKKFVDAGILAYAGKNKVAVATLDKELKKELKGRARILAIRARKKLELA